MGGGSVFLGSLSNDVTNLVELDSAYVEVQANRLNSIADLTFRDDSAARQGWFDLVRAASPRCHWRFDDTTGVVIDRMGAANGSTIGVVNRGVPGLIPGEPGYAFGFDGTGGMVQVPNLGLAQHTFGCWFRPDGAPGGASPVYHQIAMYLMGSAGHLYVGSGGNVLYQAVKASDGTTVNYFTPGNPFATLGVARWLVVTYDGTTMRIFVDGAEQGAGLAAALRTDVSAITTRIGRVDNYRTNGVVDDPFVFGRALTPAEIRALWDGRYNRPRLDIREQQEVYVYDDATRVFGGVVSHLTPTVSGLTVDYRAKCQGFDVFLDRRVVDGDLPVGRVSDAQIVAWIVAWGGDLGLTAVDFVGTLQATVDHADLGIVRGMTLRKALDRLATAVGGATYWVDEWKRVHWTNTATAEVVRGGTFESDPSAWSLTAGAVITADTGPAGTGDTALVLTSTGVQRYASQVRNVVGSRRYFVQVDLHETVAGGGQLGITWKDAGNATVGATILTGTVANTWEHLTRLVTAPATATTAIIVPATVGTTAGTVKVDNVSTIGEDAAFGVSTTPDDVRTRAMERWKRASDATNPVNRVLVLGNGISGWREHAASIAYYGRKFESVMKDDRVTLASGISSRAAATFAKSAFPRLSGGYRCRTPGLVAGTWQIVEQEVLGIVEINWIATLRVTWEGAGAMFYEVTYGVPEDDLSAAVSGIVSTFTSSEPITGASPIGTSGRDVTPPATPSGLAISTSVKTATDGTVRPYVLASWNASTDVDFDAYEVEFDVDRTNGGSLTWAQPLRVRTGAVSFYRDDLLGGVLSGVRVRAVDRAGNASGWATATIIAGRDASAPAVPSGLAVASGYRSLGVSWSRSGEPDLDRFEVRYAADGTTWTKLDARTTFAVLPDLDPTLTYSVQVRAVDRSGNVATSPSDPTPVDAATRQDAGWCAPATGQPSLVGVTDLVVDTAVLNFLQTFTADVGILTAGTLTLGGMPNTPDVLVVLDSTNRELGRWDVNGLVIRDPSNPSNRIRIAGGVLSFSNDGGVTWTTAISGAGIRADAITLGTAPGGHNAIPNASFELAEFATRLTKVWTSAADWGASIAASDVNVTKTGTELRLTTV